MVCPVCSTELKIAERQGIEIDFCPRCRGVWLDRGELDKLIERSGLPARDDDDDDDRRYGDRSRYESRDHPSPEPRKRGGFFRELFDFD